MKPSLDIEIQVRHAVRDYVKSENARRNSEQAEATLAAQTAHLPLVKLDYWERLIRQEYADANQPRHWLQRHWRKQASDRSNWLDLVSDNGYRREQALRSLQSGVPNSFFCALLLRRLNDWVPQVRAAARVHIPRIVSHSDPQHPVAALMLTLTCWNSWHRIEPSDRQVTLNLLASDRIAPLLRDNILSAPAGPMVSVLSQAGRTSILDPHLVDIAQSAVQPAVRAKAYRSLFEQRMVWFEGRQWQWTDIRYCQGAYQPVVGERPLTVTVNWMGLMRRSAADPSSIVRRVAAEFLIRSLENGVDEQMASANRSSYDVAVDFAAGFAADNSPAVLERGEFALRKLRQHRSG